MRKNFEPQITFGTVPVSNIKFDIFCRHTPILKEVEKLQPPFKVPWLDSKTVEIVWTA